MIAGIIPGILTAVAYSVLISVLVRVDPSIAPTGQPRASRRERLASLGQTWSIALLFLFIMGGIYGGYFSPSAAGAAGSFGAMVILAARRRLTWNVLSRSFMDAAVTSAMLFLIVIGGLIFSRMLVMSGAVSDLTNFVTGLKMSPIVLLLLLSLLYLILGCLVDTLSMILLTVPFVYPVIKGAGIDPIYFGILLVVYIELGAITPPVGMNLFATVAASDGGVSMDQILRGITPFILLNIVVLVVFLVVPEIITWLPQQMVR
jgi:tripartite ATP-independent transporter DctM subunit